MKKSSGIALIVLIAIFSSCNFEKKTEISQWRGPDRNGIYPEKNLLTEWPEDGPELLWKYEDLGIGHATASVTKDQVFTAGTIDSTSYIFSFDMEGNLLWKKDIGKEWMKNFPGARSTPLIYDGRGYLLNGLGKLYCFDPENGDFFWTKDVFEDFDGENITWGITENLLIDGEKLFCTPGGTESNVIALDRISGELLWKSEGAGKESSYGSPLIIDQGENRFLIVHTASSIISINIENGELAWEHPIYNDGGSHANTPIFRNDSLFLMPGSRDTTVLLKVAQNGLSVEQLWETTLLSSGMGDGVLLGDNLYCGANRNGTLYSIDWSTGKAIDSLENTSKGRMKGRTTISAEGLLYCFGFSGKFELIKPGATGFETKGSFQVGDDDYNHWAHPVIKDGRLYIRHKETLWVYQVGKE